MTDEIIVGVDGSPSSERALRWAVAESAWRGWPVKAVLAWGHLDQHHVEDGAAFDPDYDEDDAAAALDAYVERSVGAEAAATVLRRVENDLAVRSLLASAQGAALLVLGARGLGGFKAMLLGSVSQHCLHHAPCPVAVIRPDTPTEPSGRVAVAIDGSPSSSAALRWAIAEATARRAELEVLHAWQLPLVGGDLSGAAALNPDVFSEGAQQVLDDAVAAEDTSGLPSPVRATLLFGGPATTVLDATSDVDLLVVGARGVGAVERFLLGSVSHRIVQRATVPVVVVPHP